MNPTDSLGLIFAILNGYRKLAMAAVWTTSDRNGKNGAGDTALILATKLGYLDVVQTLILAKADLNLTDAKGRTALMWAVKHQEIFELLLNSGAKTTLEDNAQMTVMSHAICLGTIESVKTLLSMGLTVIPISEDNPEQPDSLDNLHLAILRGDPTILAIVLSRLTIKHHMTFQGQQLVRLAVKSKNLTIIRMIVRWSVLFEMTELIPLIGSLIINKVKVKVKPNSSEFGLTSKTPSDFTKPNSDYSTIMAWALHRTMLFNQPPTFKLMAQAIKFNDCGYLMHGITKFDIDSRNDQGQTLLLIAAGARQPEVVFQLCREGANPLIADQSGQMVNFATRDSVSHEIIYDYLLEYYERLVDLPDDEYLARVWPERLSEINQRAALRPLTDVEYSKLTMSTLTINRDSSEVGLTIHTIGDLIAIFDRHLATNYTIINRAGLQKYLIQLVRSVKNIEHDDLALPDNLVAEKLTTIGPIIQQLTQKYLIPEFHGRLMKYLANQGLMIEKALSFLQQIVATCRNFSSLGDVRYYLTMLAIRSIGGQVLDFTHQALGMLVKFSDTTISRFDYQKSAREFSPIITK